MRPLHITTNRPASIPGYGSDHSSRTSNSKSTASNNHTTIRTFDEALKAATSREAEPTEETNKAAKGQQSTSSEYWFG